MPRYAANKIESHPGNVLLTVSDRRLPQCSATAVTGHTAYVISATDYSAFGSPLPGRTWNADGYRYGYNGKEKDDEISGSGNSYDYGFRIYNPRLGRFLSPDPMAHERSWVSPYNFVQNNPINRIDPDGALDTDLLNTETGEMMHIDDGIDQVIMVDNKAFQDMQQLNTLSTWGREEGEKYFSILQGGQKLDWNSDLGLLARINMGEMGGLGQGLDARRIVSESVLNRKNYSGIHNIKKNSKSDYSSVEGIIMDAYDGRTEQGFKDPYGYLNSFEKNSGKYGRDNIRKNVFASSIYAAYITLNETKPAIGQGVIYYGSPPVTVEHMQKNMAPYAHRAGHLKILNLNIPGISAAGTLTK